MCLYTLRFSFTATKGPHKNLFQHDSVPVHKTWSLETRFAKVDVEELFHRPAQTPDLNLTVHIWDELVYWGLHADISVQPH